MSFFLILILALAIVAPHILGPILIYLKQRVPLYREFFSLTSDEIASCTDTDFSLRANAVAALGFTPVENLQSIAPGSKIFTTIFYNFSTLETANVTEITAFRNESTVPTIRIHYIEFTARFDDLEVNTNNTAEGGVFCPLPEKQIRALPTVHDAVDLYTIHRSFTTGIASSRKPLPPAGTIEQEIQMEWTGVFRRQCEMGYFQFDASTSTFRPTVKGAILMSWKLIWPARPIRKWNTRSESQRVTRTVLGR